MVTHIAPNDVWVQVAEVLRLVREQKARTRPELVEVSRLGRNIVSLRLQALAALGLVTESGRGSGGGGRSASVWQFNGSAGHALVGVFGHQSLRIALGDLDLGIVESRRIPWELTVDPLQTCERVAAEMDDLLDKHGRPPVWGLGLGMLAPVDFRTGRSRDPVVSRAVLRWSVNFDVRAWFTRRMRLPVWVDSVSNLMAAGAAADVDAPDDLVFLLLDRGVGSGIIANGRLYRGSDWLGGEITHVVVDPRPDRVCQCGRLGCLDTFAGAWAIEADARRAVAEGRSPYLAGIDPAAVRVSDVLAGADTGDVACVEIVLQAAEAAGRALGSVITWFNPRRVIVGGSGLSTSPVFQAALKRSLGTYTLSASLEALELVVGDGDRAEELTGGLAMVREALLSPEYMAEWGPLGSPTAAPQLLERATQA